MIVINYMLLMLGTLCATLGISFYARNREAAGNIRFYILFYGLCSAVWCICYGLIGITPNLETCETIRKVGVAGINGFLLTEVFLVSEMSGVKKGVVWTLRIFSVVIAFIDYFSFSQSKVDLFIREGSWTTWKAGEDGSVNRAVHTAYIILIFLILIILGIVWIRNSHLKRLKRFFFMVFFSNFIMLFFTLPDTFLPAMGLPAISTSGIGAAACAIVMWYGATQLNSFDIRTGNIKDRLFDFLEAGVIVLDTYFRISMVNRYAHQLVGQKDYKGLKLDDFFVIDKMAMVELFANAEQENSAIRLWDKEGKKAYSVRVTAVTDDYGDPFCYMCIFLNITEEVEASSKLEIASRAKSRFLAQMSHEIRTPINAVLGMNEMILRESEESNVLEYAENIESAGNTLLTLINSILDFSKIEDGKMDIIPVQYDTASMINDLVNSVEQRVDTKGLSFKIDIDQNLPSTLIGDDVRVSQVIMNLLTNAVKYTEKGSVTFTMRVKDQDAEHVRIFVSVADTGIGIRKEDIGKLFESFERLDQVKNHNIEGTGLGISIVKSLLTMMGSKLNVESTYGVGSEFFFEIDQKIADSSPIGDYEERIKKSHQKKGDDDLISAPKARILVVDDNGMNLKVTNNLLKLCHIKPDMVSSGESAIETMREKEYDCVFLDHMMPGMDGIETLHKLQEEKLIPDFTTMIALTANAVVGARETYLAEGFHDYLSKPIELRELVKKLKKYLPPEAYEAVEENQNAEQAVSEAEDPKDAPKDQALSAEGDAEIMEFFADDDSDVLEFFPEDGSAEEAPAGNREEKRGLDKEMLKRAGINPEVGLHYCAGDADFYGEMLSDFTAEREEKAERLASYYNEKNWHQYDVLVHSMKSNLRTLGAESLSESARALEEAAKKEDAEYIREHHEAYLAAYRKLGGALQEGMQG